MLREAKSQESNEQLDLLRMTDQFEGRHNGIGAQDMAQMLETLEVANLDELIDQVVPENIRMAGTLDLPAALSESEVLKDMRELANKNKVYRSYIGMGYSGTITPPVILRNILENPGWYTQYTPYQAEIAQGRMEALINFQTMVMELTGMEISNSSLLDEGTAAAEAMAMAYAARPRRSTAEVFFISELCHPQTIDTVIARAVPLGIEVVVGDHAAVAIDDTIFGTLVQYPATDGTVVDYAAFCEATHAVKGTAIVAVDLLALTLLRAPGEFGADIVVGNTQRFGVPFGYGGPHAAFLATKEKNKRIIPGRIIGVSLDSEGKPAMRLAMQTREQHIRREKATSNICTAQVLLAVMASMYAVYHGPEGLKRIAQRVRLLTSILAKGLTDAGYTLASSEFFDTIKVVSGPMDAGKIEENALAQEINFRYYEDGGVGVSLDETVSTADLADLLTVFGCDGSQVQALASQVTLGYDATHQRESGYLNHDVFQNYHSETEMMRYIYRLQGKDLSLVHSMIPLGSCTMKLNAVTEMIPVTWPEFGQIHPVCTGRSSGRLSRDV